AEGNFDLTVSCDILPPPNDLIVNATDLSNEDFPFTDPNVPMMAATLEGGNPTDCNIDGANGVWYKGTIPQNGNVTATVVNPSGANAVTFYEAPNLNASEVDLVLVDWFENQCVAGTSASIPVVAGNSYYVFVLNSGGPTDILLEFTPTLSTNDNTIEGFAFYPNPTTGVVQLRAMDTIENVEVYNLLGQRVLIEGIASNASEINISKLNAGTYLMKVSVNGQIGTYRILKQ
ncbi:MAG: T9SS type A sorting domain-containing protein, partial [Bacteroidetes bacterium]|nr:T9SS type A sorting domain-containing protein [Bacteroidota bacterium]